MSKENERIDNFDHFEQMFIRRFAAQYIAPILNLSSFLFEGDLTKKKLQSCVS
jgi:hypothetical protein